jgi:hypothetical protein
MHAYKSLLDAARGLLGEVVSTLQDSHDGRFAVIGGWSPHLLNIGPIRHPGTRDVDVLFEHGDEPGHLAPAMEALLDRGFLLSAKHEFQLLRKLNVQDRVFVFNVDLLHPSSGEAEPEMFAEHVSLPIPESEFHGDTYAMMSIVVPGASFVFDGHIAMTRVDFEEMASGNVQSIEVPLMDETGLIITKAKSMANPKRPRDSFDVFLAIAQARDYDALITSFRRLMIDEPLVFNSLFAIPHAMASKTLQANTLQFLPGYPNWDTDEFERQLIMVTRVLHQFLTDIPLPDKAEIRYPAIPL